MDIAFLVTYFKTMFQIFIAVMWGYSPNQSESTDVEINPQAVIYDIKAEEVNTGYYLIDYAGDVDQILINNDNQQNPQLQISYNIYSK